MPNQTSAGDVVTWVGVPVEGMTGEASRAVAVASPRTTTTVDNVTFDVRRTAISAANSSSAIDAVSFESLSGRDTLATVGLQRHQGTHERQKRDQDRAVSRKQVRVPVRDPAMRDTVYNMLSDKIVAARQGVHR